MLKVLALLALILPFSTYAKAEKISIAFSMGMPPYINEDLKSGIEFEIIEAAFRAAGVEIEKTHNLHFKRAILLLKNKKIDAIASNEQNQLYFQAGFDLYGSDTTLNYVDCISTLKARKFKIKTFDDLKGKRVIAFKTASEVLGDKFKSVVTNNGLYTESVKQGLQPKLLLRKRVDAAISDRNIFHTHHIRMYGEDKSHLFEFHELIPATPRNLKFSDKTLMTKFNQGLKIIKETGVFQQIRKKHSKDYKSSCSE